MVKMKLNKTTVLSEPEIKAIHETSLKVLENTGMFVYSDKVIEILKKAGCPVNNETKLVKFPRKLIEESLKSVPNTIQLFDRNGNHSVKLGGDSTYIASGHNAVYYHGIDDPERRPITKEEVGNFALISDHLENIHIVGIEAMPQDVPQRASLVHAFDAVINNTKKPIFWSPETDIETRAIIEISKIVAGTDDLSKKPFSICQLSPTSPLLWSTGAIEAVIDISQNGIPLAFLPEPYSGVTAPITLAGHLVVHNAEVLSGILITQIVNKGTPVIYAGAWTTFNMRTASVLISTPETAILRVAGSQMAKFYNIPSHSIGPDTDANFYDEQHGWEKMLTAISAMQAGINLLVNAGMFSTGFSVSYEQLLIDHEIVSIVYRYLRGIEVNDDTLAYPVINEIGPKGNFLQADHTRKYLRTGEHFEAKISYQDLYDLWATRGMPDVTRKAKSEAEKIIASHKPEPLPSPAKSEISRILSRVEKEA
jgi:trimethylamine--corrinoid protein Co-methyltransferase